MIINKKTGEWGIPYHYESDELARVPMQVLKTSGPVENFTINFLQSGGGCTLQMSWENTQAWVSSHGKIGADLCRLTAKRASPDYVGGPLSFFG